MQPKPITIPRLVFTLLIPIVFTSCSTSGDTIDPERERIVRVEALQSEDSSIAELFGALDYGVPDPQAVEEVLQGRRSSASAAWWGFDPENATPYLQAAIDSGAKILLVPRMEQPWLIDPIFLASNQEILFQSGALIQARPGSFQGREDKLFTIQDQENITLQGYNARFQMRKKDYTNSPYKKSQHRHCIGIYGGRNIRIYGLTILESGGDGIYIRGGKKQTFSENIHINDVTLSHHHRQGISVISAQNLLIENSKLLYTRGHAPQAGIDFEPNHAHERLVQCVVRNCEIRYNRGNGVLIYLRNVTDRSEPVSISIESSVIRNNALFSVWVSNLRRNPKGRIYFGGNRISGLRYAQQSDDLKTEFAETPLPHLPPLADAGGPYQIGPGGRVRLDGSNSRDQDEVGGVFRWRWDLDEDGDFKDIGGDRPEIDWNFLIAELGLQPGQIYKIRLMVQDDDHQWSLPALAELSLAD